MMNTHSNTLELYSNMKSPRQSNMGGTLHYLDLMANLRQYSFSNRKAGISQHMTTKKQQFTVYH